MSSRISVTICRMCASIAPTARGVNPLFTRRRSLTCFGGSIVISILPSVLNIWSSGAMYVASNCVIPFSELHSPGFREISITSAYFVTFQNGLNSIVSFSSALPPGLKCTGISRRSTRNSSCASPISNGAGSARLISLGFKDVVIASSPSSRSAG